MSEPVDLGELAEQLRALDDAEVRTHPDVLEAVHARVTAELDGLVIPSAAAPGASQATS